LFSFIHFFVSSTSSFGTSSIGQGSSLASVASLVSRRNFASSFSASCSQFHQRYTRAFFVRIFQQCQNVTRKMTFVRKIRTYSVDEIDTCMALCFAAVWCFLKKRKRLRASLMMYLTEKPEFDYRM
jgi:hypothetical protein